MLFLHVVISPDSGSNWIERLRYRTPERNLSQKEHVGIGIVPPLSEYTSDMNARRSMSQPGICPQRTLSPKKATFHFKT
jgi:hypothetical protein